jgi:hypothetical protein
LGVTRARNGVTTIFLKEKKSEREERRMSTLTIGPRRGIGARAASSQLLRLVLKLAREHLAQLPLAEAQGHVADMQSGKFVIALYCAEGKSVVKINPPAEAIEACFQSS